MGGVSRWASGFKFDDHCGPLLANPFELKGFVAQFRIMLLFLVSNKSILSGKRYKGIAILFIYFSLSL